MNNSRVIAWKKISNYLVLSLLSASMPLSAEALQWYKVTKNNEGLPLIEPIYTKEVKPVPPARYHGLITQVAQQHNLDPLLIHAVVAAESAYHSDAVSNKGAIGLMQLLPTTAARFGKQNLTEPQENLEAGAAYLSQLIRRFEGRLDLAIAGYNAGEGAVIRYKNNIPPYPETQGYVRRVLSYYEQLRQDGITQLVNTAPLATSADSNKTTEIDTTKAEAVTDSTITTILTKIGDGKQIINLFIDGPS